MKMLKTLILYILLAVCVATNSFATDIILEAEADTSVRTDLNIRRNDNSGCSSNFVVGGSRGGGGILVGDPDGIRSLLRFDLSAQTHAVTSAILELRILTFFSFSPPQIYQLDVNRIIDSGLLTPWIEGNGGQPGTLPGCDNVDPAFGVAWVGAGDGGDANNQTQPDFDPARSARTILDEADFDISVLGVGVGDFARWNITELVNGWISGTYPNHGLMLRDTTGDGMTFRHIFFTAREAEDSFMFSDPRLTVGPRLILGPIAVDIDIKPGSDINSINLKSAGVITVAILSTGDFDATTVDPDTVNLAGATVKVIGKGNKFMSSEEDVNGDNIVDLEIKVETMEMIIEPGDSTAVLEAETFAGRAVRGEDTIRIVPD